MYMYLEDWYVRCDGDVSAVEDRCPAVEGVGVERDIVAATESNFS